MKERPVRRRIEVSWNLDEGTLVRPKVPAALARTSAFVERHLARRAGALSAALTAAAFFAAVGLQEWVVYGQPFGSPPGKAGVDALIGSLYLAANVGTGLALTGVAAVAVPQFPWASLIGLGWLLLSHTFANFYNLVTTPEVYNWVCDLLGIRVGAANTGGLIVDDEAVRTALIFYQDVTQMIGGVMLGAVTLRLSKQARPSSYLFMALAAWAVFDMTVSAFGPNAVLHWSDVTFTLLSGAQGAICAAWFWRRSRREPAAVR